MPTENRSSNTEMVSELLPCPFCGQQDFLIERLDSDASVVICQGLTGPHEACLARGPVGVVQNEGEEQPGRDKAVELWNARAEQHQGEPVAWRYRHAEPGMSWFFTEKPEASGCLVDGFEYEVFPLYTHADPGEIERLRSIIERQRNLIASLRAELAESRSIDASAEPSAAIEIDHDALVAAVCVLRSQGLGNLSAAVEEARTALDRKPS